MHFARGCCPAGQDVLTAEQRERRMREVEAEVASLVGWGTEEDGGTWGGVTGWRPESEGEQRFT